MLDFSQESLQQDAPLTPRRSTTFYEAKESFLNEARAFGLNIDDIAIGEKNKRVSTESKPQKRNGWISFDELHPGFYVGCFGDWQKGEDAIQWSSWTDSGITDEERSLLKRKQKDRDKKIRDSAMREQVEKAAIVNQRFSQMPPCTNHGYSTKKKIGLYGDVRLTHDGAIAVPLVWTDGSIVAMQRIYPNGDKRFDGVINGADVKPFAQILGENDHIYLVEGFSTGCSVHEATGKTVIIALTANRLKSIGKIVRSKVKKTPITIVADNDCHLQVNKGIKCAREAADAINADVIIPDIGDEQMDANDVHCSYGLEVLKTILGADGRSKYGILPMREVVEKNYPHNPIVEGLIDEGECAILGGDSNLGKSIISLHIAALLADKELDNPQWASGNINFSGPPMLFGHFPILSRSKTLFLQNENSGKNIKKRFVSMCESSGKIKNALDSDHIFTVTIGDENDPCADGVLTDPELFRALKINILKEKIRLLVVDPMSSYTGSEDENNSAEMLPLLNKTFKRLARETGCACLIIHHVGKEGIDRGLRGSSSIKGWADCVLLGEEIESDDDGKVIRMVYDKARSFERRPSEWYMRMTNSLDFELLEDYEPPNEQAANKKYADSADVERIVMSACEVRGKSKLIEMVAGETGTSKASCKIALQKAVDNGSVKCNRGNGRMDPIIYTAT